MEGQYTLQVHIQAPRAMDTQTHKDTVKDFVATILSGLPSVESFDIVEVKE